MSSKEFWDQLRKWFDENDRLVAALAKKMGVKIDMNDKQQLAAMGEYMAEQSEQVQPLCMAKRIEGLEALLAEAREMMDNQPRGLSGTIKRIDAALSGKLPELLITKPARIGGVVFQPGIKASLVIEAAYRAAEHHESDSAAFQELQDAMLAGLAPTTAVPEGWQLVPVEPTPYMQGAGCQIPLNKAARHNAVYKAMLAAAPKPDAKP